MIINRDKVIPTKAGVTDLVHLVNCTIRKSKTKEERARMHIVKSELMKLKEELL